MERITPRFVFEARIRIRMERASQNLVMEGWARDISGTGISAFVAQGLIVGELVTLEIPLASSRWHSIPAKVARCTGTQYGFQFTALSTGQRENIRFAVRDHQEMGAYDRDTEPKSREHQPDAEEKVLAQEQATRRAADTAFADRARMLIKRGYTPKVAVELVLHEVEFEQGINSRALDKARADADDFLREHAKASSEMSSSKQSKLSWPFSPSKIRTWRSRCAILLSKVDEIEFFHHAAITRRS